MRITVRNFLYCMALILFLVPEGVGAQKIFPDTKYVKGLFPKAELQKIQKAKNIIVKGNKFRNKQKACFSESNNLIASADLAINGEMQSANLFRASQIEKTGIDYFFKASSEYKIGFSTLFNVYKKNLNQVHKRIDKVRLVQGQQFENEAQKQFNTAQKKRAQSYKAKSEIKAVELLNDAHNLEILALDNQLKALAYYSDWLLNKGRGAASNESPSIEYENASNLGFVLDKMIEADKTKTKSNTWEKTKTSYKKTGNNIRVLSDGGNTANIGQGQAVYRIQILAVKNVQSIENIRKIYKGNLIITEEYENNLYKYSIGAFQSYEEANAYKKKLRIKNSFVTSSFSDFYKQQRYQPKNSVYRIQVAATRSPIAANDLKKFERYKQIINIDKRDGWYRYSIGNFGTYDDANQFKKWHKMTDAFIISANQ